MRYSFLILSVLFSILQGQSKVGTSAAQFLGIGVGPRAMGMSGAFTAIIGDASSLYWNPGSISRLPKSEAQFTKTDWLVETDLSWLAVVIKIGPSNALGLYWTYLDYGREEVTDVEHQDGTGLYWTASDMAVGLSFARNLTDRFSVGGSVKYINQNIYHESASSIALDMGLLYLTTNERLRIGMSISNFGMDMILDGKDLLKKIDLDPVHEGHNETIVARLKTDRWPLPLFFRVGTSSDLIRTGNLTLTSSVDAVIPSDDVEAVNLGMELGLRERVFVRMGYRSLGIESSEESLTLGAGVNLYASGMSLRVDYAVQDFGIFGYVPHLGVSVQF